MRTPIFPSPIPEKKPRKIKRSFIEDFPNRKLTKFKRPIFPFAKPVKMHPKPTYAFQNNDLTEPTARPTVWQSPTLRKSNKTAFWFMFCLAAFFTVWSIFLMSILPGIVLDEGNALALIVMIFPAATLWMFWYLWQLHQCNQRFGDSVIELETYPAFLGHSLRGHLQVTSYLPPDTVFQVKLSSVELVSGKGGEKSSRFNILWQAEQHIPISAEHMNTGRIPIFFDIPHDQIPTDCEHDLNPKFWLNKSYSWSLEIYAKLEGADFKQTIKIPIYDPETTTRDIPTSTTHMARNETHVANYSYDGDWRKTGVIYTDYGDDGSFYYFPAARHKASTMFVTVVGIILSVFTIGLFLESGGRLMACFVGVFAFVFIWATVKGWFYKSSLDVSKTHVHIRKGFLSGRIYSFDPSDILSVSPSGHMQEDVKSYFDIKVRTISGKTIKLAWGLLGKRDVESLCDKIRQDLGRDMTRDPHVVKAGNFTLLKMQNM